MTIDLRQMILEPEIGKPRAMDISKPVANVIYKETADIGVMQKAVELYNNGEADIPQWMLPHIIKIIEGSGLFAYVKVPLLATLKK